MDQTLAHHATRTDEHIEHALRDPRVERELSETERGHRRQLRGLEHHGIAARERRTDLPARDVEREVPGHDEAHNPERLAKGHVDAAGDRDGMPVVLVDRAGVEMEDLGHHPHLAAQVRDGFADVPGLEQREFLGVLLNEPSEAAQQTGAVGGRHRAPPWKRGLRRRDRAVRFLDTRRLQLGERLLRRRVQQAECHPRSKKRSRS